MTHDHDPNGWDAIDEVVGRVYPKQRPKHYGEVAPLEVISVFENATAGRAWWHFVTCGLTELYEKETEDLRTSGYGFELTLRLAKRPGETEPPIWAISFLQNIARYVFETGETFAPGDHMDANGPIAREEETRLTAFALVEDDLLGRVRSSPNGGFVFLQIVGLTADEREAILAWDGESFLRLLQEQEPRLVTDLARGSALKATAFRRRVEEGISRDGSSTEFIAVEQLAYESPDEDRHVITIGAIDVPALARILPHRIPRGRDFSLCADDLGILFALAGSEEKTPPEFHRIELSSAEAEAIARTVRPARGEYIVSRRITVRVEPTAITDEEGNIVREVG